MAFRKPETDAELELVTASLKKFVPDVATHSRSISGKKGAALVNQAGYERSATSASISLISWQGGQSSPCVSSREMSIR